MDKTKQAGAQILETLNLLELDLRERDEELRSLTDVELRLAGGGEDIGLW